MTDTLRLLCSMCLFFSVHTFLGNYFQESRETFICRSHSDHLEIRHGYDEKEVLACLEAHKEVRSLKFTDSGLEEVPEYLNILNKLIFLDLSSNNISNGSFVSISDGCKKLQTVILDGNAIHKLRKGDLDCLQSLQQFSISNNSLSTIENGTFNKNHKNLVSIYLFRNHLKSLDSSLIYRLLFSSNVSMRLNVSRNDIAVVTNSINITIEDFTPSTDIFVALLHNNFTRVDLNYYLRLINVTNKALLYRLWNSGFDLRFNPFVCDCYMYELATYLRKFYNMDPDNPVFAVTCASPSSLNGTLVRKVPSNQFNCSVTYNCPKYCSCVSSIALNLTTVRCNDEYVEEELPQKCPADTHLVVNIKSGNLKAISPRRYFQNVTTLDVSQCSVTYIDPDIVNVLKNITDICINDNNLRTIPKEFEKIKFEKTQTLLIHRNPFDCDCHTGWMKQWLLKNKLNIPYQDQIICASGPGKGKAVTTVPDNQFTCSTGLPQYEIIAIVVGSLLFLVLVTSVFVANKTRVQVFMISNCALCRYLCRGVISNTKLYDVFVTHSCDDDNVVLPLVEKLKGENPPYKVCTAEFDFRPGETIVDNIITSIESSHNVLIMLSNSFLGSAWCNMEFREAHTRFLRDRNVNIILIVLEDLDPNLVYNELKTYMDTHTYLNYNDIRFWERLLNRLETNHVRANSERTPLLTD